MLVEISGPVFKCAEDENIFFSRLHGMAGCDSVTGKGLNIYLTLEVNTEKAVIDELQEICKMWNTTFRIM